METTTNGVPEVVQQNLVCHTCRESEKYEKDENIYRDLFSWRRRPSHGDA
jgi:hypothetical protein